MEFYYWGELGGYLVYETWDGGFVVAKDEKTLLINDVFASIEDVTTALILGGYA